MVDFVRTQRRLRPLMLTPLVDIFFLLIIFFLLTTVFIKIQAMELGLPGKGTTQTSNAAPASPVIISIASNGAIYWEGKMVLQEMLRRRLDDLLKKDTNASIMVRSGKSVSVQKLVSVLDIVYLAGGKGVSVDKWNEKDIASADKEEEQGKALEKAIEEEDNVIPILKEKEVEALPKGPFAPQDQFDKMLEMDAP